jgi:tryptophan-rich sensory protein
MSIVELVIIMEKKGIVMGIFTAIFGSITIVAIILFLQIKNGHLVVEDVGELIAGLLFTVLGVFFLGAISIVGGIITGIFLIITIIIAIKYYSNKETTAQPTYSEEPKL